MTPKGNDKETEEIIQGLAGSNGFKLGEKLYIFTVTYHYIGRVAYVNERLIILEDAEIVMNAGSANDAVSRIVQGKSKPEVSERPGKPIRILIQSITAAIQVQ